MLTHVRTCLATLLVGVALGGCGPRVQAPKSVAAAPLPTPHVEETPDAFVDLSAIARVLTLPPTQQEPIWRTWAREHSSDDRQNFALAVLARRDDPADVPFILDAFEHGDSKARRTASRALLAFAPDLSQASLNRLYSSVQQAPAAAAPETVWALVEAQDARIYDLALAGYRRGAFNEVKTIDNHAALDPAMIGQLDLKRTLTLVRDQDENVRLLVARTCSRVAQIECAPWLLQLARDRAPNVRAAAAPGLVKLGSDETSQVLTQMLRAANPGDREKLLFALRDEAGLSGLVAALDSVSPEPELGLEQSTRIFDLILGRDAVAQTMLDQRGVDALDDYMQHAPHEYGRTWAALALARLGDMRSVSVLAARLRLTPQKAYPGDSNFEVKLRRSDDERVFAARAIEQLAEQYPDRLSELRRISEDALLEYVRDPNYRHPSALAALAKLRSTKIVPQLRTWTSVKRALPKSTDDFAKFAAGDWRWSAESLRALGQMRDAGSLTLLEKHLLRRPRDLDLSMQGLADDPNRALGLALRVLDSGAIGGLAELGGAPAADALFLFADEPLENEVNRTQACQGLAWAANESQLREVLERVRSLRGGTNTLDARLHCFLTTFATRAAVSLKRELVGLLEELSQADDVASGFLVGQALGRTGVDGVDEPRLLALLQRSDRSALPAALALLAGARPEIAQLVGLRLLGRPPGQVAELRDAYEALLRDISDEDLSGGALYRWVGNAFALEYLGGNALDWPRATVAQRLAGLVPQIAAHSMNGLQLRLGAQQAASEGNSAAAQTLLAAGEGGALLSLRERPGPSSHLAHHVYAQLLHGSVERTRS